jgi:dipeptidase D
MENRKAIVIGHLDMVHQKNSDTILISTHKESICMLMKTGRARGTTLGADNGLGVAAMAAESKDCASCN